MTKKITPMLMMSCSLSYFQSTAAHAVSFYVCCMLSNDQELFLNFLKVAKPVT